MAAAMMMTTYRGAFFNITVYFSTHVTDTCKSVNIISGPKETAGSVVNLVPICIRKAHWQPFTLNLLKDRPPANPK